MINTSTNTFKMKYLNYDKVVINKKYVIVSALCKYVVSMVIMSFL